MQHVDISNAMNVRFSQSFHCGRVAEEKTSKNFQNWKKIIPISITSSQHTTMTTSFITLIALIAAVDAWKVKIAGAFGDMKCDIKAVGSTWQVSFGEFVLGSFSQQPTSCVAAKLHDDLVFSYIVQGDDKGELKVRIPNGCATMSTPFKQTACGVTSIVAFAGNGTAIDTTCGVKAGKCDYVEPNYCELYTCSGTAASCSSNVMLASFSFDVALTPNTECSKGGALTDASSILAVGTPSGTPGGMSSCCNVPGKQGEVPAPSTGSMPNSASHVSALVAVATTIAAAIIV
jgi:hypothetical protein